MSIKDYRLKTSLINVHYSGSFLSVERFFGYLANKDNRKRQNENRLLTYSLTVHFFLSIIAFICLFINTGLIASMPVLSVVSNFPR